MEKFCIPLRSPRWSPVFYLHYVAIVSCKQVLRIKRIHNDNIQLTIIYAGLNEKYSFVITTDFKTNFLRLK